MNAKKKNAKQKKAKQTKAAKDSAPITVRPILRVPDVDYIIQAFKTCTLPAHVAVDYINAFTKMKNDAMINEANNEKDTSNTGGD